MKVRTGIWIDHRQAIVVRVFEHGEDLRRIDSNLPKRVRFSGVSHNQDEPHDDFSEDKRERRYQDMLNHYYDEVIAEIGNSDSLFIMGPGEAKQELKKRLESDILISHLEAVEAADKLTDNQIIAKVKAHFEALDSQEALNRSK